MQRDLTALRPPDPVAGFKGPLRGMEGQGREGREWTKGERRDYPPLSNSVRSPAGPSGAGSPNAL